MRRFGRRRYRTVIRILCYALIALNMGFVSLFEFIRIVEAIQLPVSPRRVNIPFASVKSPASNPTSPAIFWFGKVDPTTNYADVRMIHDQEYLTVIVHIFDRQLWYDINPSVNTLTEWDAVSLYLNLDGNAGDMLTANAHHFIAQLNHSQSRENYQATFRGAGLTWETAAAQFESVTGWRGSGINNSNSARGWWVKFTVPFTSLGFSQKPSPGTVWGLAMAVHDRDDAIGAQIPEQVWPENVKVNSPSTWGQLSFGIPASELSYTLPEGSTTIRHGLNGVIVPDAHVGGHSVCGKDFQPNFFEGWGDANYAGYRGINIQNQWDVADWPCFSKYYINFPLDSLPKGKEIISANLTLYQFGSAWGEIIEPAWIQVLTVQEDWEENRITWNNAPFAKENISGAWVNPLNEAVKWPGLPHHWDVSRPVSEAYGNGEPLRLALYSADYSYNSGRYFNSSDVGDWNAVGRPTLTVLWGAPENSKVVSRIFIPIIQR
jgi:hypothetical protein